MANKAQILKSLSSGSGEMLTKDEVVSTLSQHGISEQDAKKGFEKVDIDNDGELPKGAAVKILDALSMKMGK
ncbi:hypothetical protein BJX70DRAFT_375802 [Aspergillus crustosus]